MSAAADEMSGDKGGSKHDDGGGASGVKRGEPMAKHTSWRVGGPADLYFKPRDAAELARFLAALPRDVPVHFVGLGSNLLVRDGGVRGAVVATGALKGTLERVDETAVRASAGVPCMRLARECVRWHLGPAAFFAGIPGTVGGALAMNAGAFGGETWRHVERVETIDRGGVRRQRAREEFTIGYRRVDGPPGEWFLGATFRLEHDAASRPADIRDMLARRNASQPLGAPSCGSVFRNPPGSFAGRLIEECGLKGARIGGAFVSEKHANFIINGGAASADDIERLIDLVRRTVHERSGVLLELEARVIGERREAAA
ncbi:MAG TPA: UDP-N-acetylmuramate dehydrogenase [Gammaproteobacteria bacterium]|nr:UDP-N-acetylmuramate dehydrogenase [Gammaproteobacteria bacterium]